MVLTTPEHVSASAKRHAASLFISISALMAVCAKKAVRASQKLKNKSTITQKIAPKSSPLVTRPKQLLTTISNKAIPFMLRKKTGEEGSEGRPEEEWGDGGVWQRTILMGDKCQPLDFSGVIYYDSNGKQLDEVPIKSPRASPLPGYLTRAGKSEF